MFEESTEITINTIRKIKNMMEYLRALRVDNDVIFYVVGQVVELISLDPSLAESFIEDKYIDGDWKILWKDVLSRFSLTYEPLINGCF